MNIIVSAKNFPLTKALKDFATLKTQKLGRLWKRIISVHFELQSEKSKTSGTEFTAKARVVVPGPDIEAEGKARDMYKAIDNVVQKIKIQLGKVKGKLIDKKVVRDE